MAAAAWEWSRRRPALWMAALVAVGLLVQALRPEFVLTRRVDSASYTQLANAAGARDLLASVRTPGYPLFLRGVRALCPGLWCLPHVQLVIFGLSVLALFEALRRFGVSAPGAAAAALPLLASPLVPYFVPAVMTEALAAGLALCVLALVLLLAVRRGAGALWALLGAATFATYLVRPGFVFLVALVPLALAALRRAGDTGAGRGRRSAATLLGAFALCLLPLLAWSVLRWRVVGDFGLVSFTGYHLTGIAASMLDEDVVAALPLEQRGLAAEILRRRQRAGLTPVRSALPFARWREKHNTNTYKFALPLARGEYRRASTALGESARHWPRDVYVNRRLTGFARAVIAARPGLYLKWLAGAWVTALALLIAQHWLWATGVFALVGAAVRKVRQRGAPQTAARELEWSRTLSFLALAAAFAVSALALVLFLQPPEWRYLLSVMLPLPGALAAVGVEGLRSLRRGAPGPAESPPAP
ncbi:MAG TPA: hypothetical protein VFE44_09030 [Thermoanaerobaculia bacterium]|nr:hypothetical protein [Thermoanaerobaculia bacterium]